MTRQLFFAITLISTGVFLNPQAQAASAQQCEDRNANCLGRCADFMGGSGDMGGHQNKCLSTCDRRLISCVVRTVNRR
jgi:hypothetical protein